MENLFSRQVTKGGIPTELRFRFPPKRGGKQPGTDLKNEFAARSQNAAKKRAARTNTWFEALHKCVIIENKE